MGVYDSNDNQIVEMSKKGAWFRFDHARFDSGYGYVTIGKYGYEGDFWNDEPLTIYASEISTDNIIFGIYDIQTSIRDENNNRVFTYGYGIGGGRDFLQLGVNSAASGMWLYANDKRDYLYDFAYTVIHGYTYIDGNLKVRGDLAVTGAKPRLVNTQDYGERFLYCYEMASPVFGDFGSGETDEAGVCYVEIDDILRETISDLEYHVFVTKEGQGDLWVSEKATNYFVVQGTPGLKFAWELKAIQRDYEAVRTENPSYNSAPDDNPELESIYDNDLESYYQEMEALYETA
jgi:hypothetical protein